jgi:integrase
MINRNNWKLTKEYLEYKENIDQLSNSSIKVEATYIRNILIWADNISFLKIYSKRPSFSEYLQKARNDGMKDHISPEYTKKNLAAARRFFYWLSENHNEYKVIKSTWINSLKPKKVNTEPKKKDVVLLKDILQIAEAKVDNIVERRIRAAACFWFLTGIRIGAFVSLKIKAVDIDNGIIYQYPNLGVRTKNSKYGKTFFLNIPELLEVVKAWDNEIKKILPEDGFWFAPLSPDTKEIDPYSRTIGDHRNIIARRNLKNWLEKVGLAYHSPHKFRHGHIQYGMQNAKTIADYKAVSMNVMHSSMDITDEVYSQLGDDEIKNRIGGLNLIDVNSIKNIEDEYILFKEFLAWRESKNK